MTRVEKIENFIGCYDGYLDKTLCDNAINLFEKRRELKETFNRMQSERASSNLKSDEQLYCSEHNIEFWRDDLEPLMINFIQSLNHYTENSSILKYAGIENLNFTTLKIQKTKPGQGYHIWHVERSFRNFELAKRILVFTIYLNEVEGGETEFLFQNKRIEPKTGRICIFPANFPYIHRGNPPLKGDKYILTSWLLA